MCACAFLTVTEPWNTDKLVIPEIPGISEVCDVHNGLAAYVFV